MSRKNRRMSRPLLGVLALVLVVGTVATIHKLKRSSASVPVPGTAQAGTIASADTKTSARIVPLATPTNNRGGSAANGGPLITSTPTAPAASANTGSIASVKATDAVKPVIATPASPAIRNQASDGSPPATQPSSGGMSATGSSNPSAVLANAQRLVADGKLIDARTLLNRALAGGTISADQQRSIRQQLSEINQTVVFSAKKFPDDTYATTHAVKPGDRLARIASDHALTWEFLARINNISDPAKMRAGASLKVIDGPFHAVVDKSDFTLDLYLGSPGEAGSIYISTLRVGLGKEDSTPAGTWIVKLGSKLKNPKFWGAGGLAPMEADDPQNPLGEYWIGLDGTDGAAINQDGYGIHGTIDPKSIGTQASLGCVRLADADIKLVYEMLVEGKSTVLVKP